MRCKPILALSVVALLAAAACDDDPAPAPDDSSATPQAQPSCGTDSPIDVTDKGWSVVSSGDGVTSVSFAAVAQNTSDSMAVSNNGTIQVTFLDKNGDEIGYGDSDEPAADSFDLGPLHPGGENAISGKTLLAEEPDTVEFTPTGACLIDDAAIPAGDITVTEPDLSLDGDELSGSLAVNSSREETVDAYPILVFRDSDGGIVGGGPYPTGSGTIDSFSVAPGDSFAQLTVDAGNFIPSDADLDATTVYAQPAPA